MVKKSIIAIAIMMSMFAAVSYGQDVPSHNGEFKVDGLWPATVTITYTPQVICKIPVYIKVGMFIQIKNCDKKKIVMEQVNCNQGQGFPCYKGCVDLEIRSNFDAKLSLSRSTIGSIVGNNNWKAYFTDGGPASSTWLVTGDGSPNLVQLCAEAWDANIYGALPGSETQIGEISILAVPTATPDCSDYCD
jgi:hypothetical protein